MQQQVNQIALLVEIAKQFDLFRGLDGRGYAGININGHTEYYLVTGKPFVDFLAMAFFRQYHNAVSLSKVRDACATIDGYAKSGKEFGVYCRIAPNGPESIIIDLCDPDWRVVEITPEGWQILQQSPVRFIRHKGMLSLATPEHGGSLSQLRHFINVSDEEWPLILAWLIATLNPDMPYPILHLTGQYGAAKSTAAGYLKRIIDPNESPLRSFPRNNTDLVIAANHARVLAFDNVSDIRPGMSDDLCRLSTGGGLGKRTLYSDDDEYLWNVRRPVIINSIGELPTRGDLLSRSIIVTFQPISNEARRQATEIDKRFNEALTSITGALFDAGVLALRNEKKLERLPRMADFAQWAFNGLGELGPAFLAAYDQNISYAQGIALESSQLAQEVMEMELPFDGSYRDLLDKLTDPEMNQPWLPKSPKALANELRGMTQNLASRGIKVEEAGHGHSGNKVKIGRW